MHFVTTIIIVICLLLPGEASKEICRKLSNCKCQHSKGVVDLSSVANKEFSVTKGNQLFRFFPCQQTADMGGSCKKSGDNAVCVQDTRTGHTEDWGSEMSVSFLVPNPVDYSVIIAKFESSDSKRKTEIYLACPKERAGRQGLELLEVQGDNAELRLTSDAACYTKPTPPITPSPIHPATITPSPIHPATITPSPIHPATITPSPIHPATIPALPIHTKTPVTPIHTPTITALPIHTKSHTSPATPTSATFSINLGHLGHWYLLAGCLVLAFLCLLVYVLVGLVAKYRRGTTGGGSAPLRSVCGLFCDGVLFVFSCFPWCRHAIGRGSRGGYEPIGVEEGYAGNVNNLRNHRHYNSTNVNNNNNNNNNNNDLPKRSCSIL